MKAWIYTTHDASYVAPLGEGSIGWFEEIDSIEDLLKVLDKYKAKNNDKVHELVISRFDAGDLAHAMRYKQPIADIKVEIYDDYRE